MTPTAERSTHDYEFFIGLAGHLQIAMGLKNVLLPCRNVAEVMDVHHSTIARYCRWAVADGYLVITKKHTFHSKRKMAAEYRANPNLWKGLKNRITTGTPAPGVEDMEWQDWSNQ